MVWHLMQINLKHFCLAPIIV